MARVYFVRHGESEANLLRVFSNRDANHGLTPTGRAQVKHLAERLADVPFAAFYCSPVLRARQSADILSDRLGVAYVVSSALTEYDVGILEGRSDEASWKHYWRVREAWQVRGEYDARVEGGESFNDVRSRFLPLIEELRARPAEDHVLLLGHGGTYACMLPLVLSNVDQLFALDHALGHTEAIIAELSLEKMTCLSWGPIQLDTTSPSPSGKGLG